jgi:hypothetical protein
VALREPEIEESADERGGELRRDAGDELVQRRPAGERLHELLVVEDLVANLGELLLRQVQEREAFEALRIDAIRDPDERHALRAELADQARGVDGRLRR